MAKAHEKHFFFGLFTIYYFCYTLSLNVVSLCRNKTTATMNAFRRSELPTSWLCMRYQRAFACVYSHSLCIFCVFFFALRIFLMTYLRFVFIPLALAKPRHLLNVLKLNCNFNWLLFWCVRENTPDLMWTKKMPTSNTSTTRSVGWVTGSIAYVLFNRN